MWKIAATADTEIAAWNAAAVIRVYPIGKKVVKNEPDRADQHQQKKN